LNIIYYFVEVLLMGVFEEARMDIFKKEVKFSFQNKTFGWIKSELSASE